MTELEAVNIMLECIGESPVSALPSTLPEAITAQTILARVSKQVQSEGWGFNTENEYELTLTTNQAVLPANVLRIDTTDKSIDAVVVGTKLYDRKQHSNDFSSYTNNNNKLSVDIIWFRQWTDLPEYAQNYISIKAGRLFARRVVTSEVLEMFTERDEIDALKIMSDADNGTTGYNIFNNETSWNILGGY